MVDVGKTIGGSPWDEPLPEEKNTKKPMPTVVGDLSAAQNQPAATADQQKTMELKIPTDTDEKVGVKISPAVAAPVPAPQAEAIPVKAETSTPSQVPQQPAAKPATDPIRSAGSVQPDNGAHSTSSGQPSGGSVDFWQSVYGQAGNPGGETSNKDLSPLPPEAAIPVSQSPVAAIKPRPVPPTVSASQPIADSSHLHQSVPVSPPPAAQIPIQPSQLQPAPQQVTQPNAPTPQVSNVPVNRLKTFIIAGILGLIILFAGGIFLTEKGLISIGLEKVYGAVHLEALWRGLPANAENAFAISAVKMKSESSFKISGSATITVNKGVKSNFISPIVSSIAMPTIAFKDQQMGPAIKAVLTAVSSDEIFTDTSDTSADLFQTDDTTGLSQSDSSSSTTSDSSSDAATAPTVGSSTTSGISTTQSSLTTIEELTTTISSQITDSVSGVDIGIKSSKNSNSSVQLVYAKNKMYLKSSSDIIYDTASKGGWTSFNLNKFGSDSPSQALWGNNFSGSNFSIVGSRGNGEVINGVRCFHYTGRATIGDTLSNLGLTDSSVSSLDLDFWLGTKDHLLYKLTMKIIPGSQSAISRIDATLNFSDYGGSSSDFIVPATSLPYSGITNVISADLSTAKGRDTQRKSDLASIAKSLESYHSAQNRYPQVLAAEKISSTAGTLYSALVPTYLTTLPLDPNSPTNYYGYKSDGTTYNLTCVLEDTTDTSGKLVGSIYLYTLSSL